MNPRLRKGVQIAALLIGLCGAFALGYAMGLRDQGPQHRALVTVRRKPGNPNSMGRSCQWYDVRLPWEAARLKRDEQRLTEKGVEHYVTEGFMSWSLEPRPDRRRADAHR